MRPCIPPVAVAAPGGPHWAVPRAEQHGAVLLGAVLLGAVLCGAVGCHIEVDLPATGVSRAPELSEPDSTDPQPDAVLQPTFYIQSVDPTESDIVGGVRVALRGNRFTEPVRVFFGGVEASGLVFQGETQLTCDAPPHQAGWVDIEVERGDGQRTVAKGAFRYRGEIEIFEVTPREVPSHGGSPVTLHGRGFRSDSEVLVGGRAALSVQAESDSRLHIVVPDGTPGPADVIVSSAGRFARARDLIDYRAAVEIEEIVPPVGRLDAPQLVHLTGTGLGAVDSVRFGGRDAIIVEHWSDDTVAVWIEPPEMPSVVDVAVSTSVGYDDVPRSFAWIDPNSAEPGAWGPLPGEIDISGHVVALALSAVEPDASLDVLLDGVSVPIVEWSADLSTVWFDAPPRADEGDVLVQVRLGDLVLEPSEPLRYRRSLRVEAVSPATLGSAGGEVTLSGDGFAAGLTVRVGGALASVVAVESPTSAVVHVEPTTPRLADVHVALAGETDTLSAGLWIGGGALELIASTPAGGSVAGGSFVRLFGRGFEPDAEVVIGGRAASGVVVHGGTLVTAYAPPGSIGPADVLVRQGGAERLLPGAFEYYEPTSAAGGAWGDRVDESVNIAVIEAGTSRPISGALTMLRAGADSPFIGSTNLDGLITFGGPGLRGAQTVTAAKVGYVSASTVGVDAGNVTVALIPYIVPPPGGGGEPPQPAPLGRISGRVIGLEKYVPPAVGSCQAKGEPTSGPCAACPVDACDAGLDCVGLLGQGNRCLAPCVGSGACEAGWFCALTGSSGRGSLGHCVPLAGEPYARCVTSTSSMGGANPEPGEGAQVFALDEDTYGYDIVSRLGEVAVLCEAGYADFDTGEERPIRWGVARHVVVPPGTHVTGVDVELEFELTATMRLIADDPPLRPNGPDLVAFLPFLELGTDGFIALRAPSGLDPAATYPVPYLPPVLKGVLYDARYVVRGGTYSQVVGGLPYSVVHRDAIERIGSSGLFVRGPAGAWARTLSPALADLSDVHGVAFNRLWAVGSAGTIVAFNGGTWSLQPTPTAADLHALHVVDADLAYAVGAEGAVLRFDGVSWKAETAPTSRPLRAVWANGAEAFAAGWFSAFRRAPEGWEPIAGAPERDWRAIWGQDGKSLWLGGAHGAVAHFNGSQWTEAQTPIPGTVRDLWGAGGGAQTYVVAVGDSPDVAVFDGAHWSTWTGPGTAKRLTSVWGEWGEQGLQLWVADDAGAIHHWAQGQWDSEVVHEEGGVLSGVYVPPLPAAGLPPGEVRRLFAVGSGAIRLGPFMRIPGMSSPPHQVSPLAGVEVHLELDPGVDPHFRYGVLSDASGLPLWTWMVRGDIDRFALPDLDGIAGLPGLLGGSRTLLAYSAYMPGFDMDAYSNLDLRVSGWSSWSLTQFAVPTP